MQQLTNTITSTPVWVWIILVAIIIVGFALSREHKLNFWRSGIVASAFCAWAIFYVSTRLSPVHFAVPVLIAGGAIGCFVGLRYVAARRLETSPEIPHLTLRGSWIPFLVIIAVFFARYYHGMRLFFDQNAGDAISVIVPVALTMGFSSGFFLGFSLAAFRHARYQSRLILAGKLEEDR